MKWISLIPTPYKLIGLALVTAGLIGVFLTYRQSLINQGRDVERALCNAGKVEAINDNLRIKEKSDNIDRIDNNNEYINRLRNNTI